MNKQLVAGILSVGTLVSFAGIALAATITNDSMHGAMKPSGVMMMHPPAPMILIVSPSGRGLLRGVVESVATSSLTVAAWGGTWTVNVTGNTYVMPGALSSIAIGEYVGASGTVSEDGPTMTADVVRDWTKHVGTMMHQDSMMQGTTSGAVVH